MIVILILILFYTNISSSLKPNVCKYYNDYFYMENSPNCWYNPDVNATLSQLITSKGYPFETYKVMAKDGYITDLNRIPRPKPNNGVIYLLHPATVTSAVWVDKGREHSLAFLLYDAGFDVWLGNSRGSDYGREHATLSPSSPKYWDFSFHEMGVYDLPKHLEFVKNYTQNKMAFIGHSMGCTVAYIYAALKPQHAKEHVNVFVLMSAGGLFKNVKVPFLPFLSSYVDVIYELLKSINYNEIASKHDSASQLVVDFCRTPVGLNICQLFGIGGFGVTESCYAANVLKLINYVKIASKDEIIVKASTSFCKLPAGINVCPHFTKAALGFNADIYKAEYMPIFFNQYPGGVPLKAYAHYGQWLSADHLKYRMFNYGPFHNRRIYKSNLPPLYPIHKITTPVLIMYGTNDWLSTPEGVEEFYNWLPDEAKIYGKLEIKHYNHGDFLIATDVVELAYKPLIKFLQQLDYNLN